MALEIRNIPTLYGESAINFLDNIEKESKIKVDKDKVEIMKNKCQKILQNANIN